MKKNTASCQKAPVKEKDLAWVKGSSGYSVDISNRDDTPPDGGG
jgi:hypothetical protein